MTKNVEVFGQDPANVPKALLRLTERARAQKGLYWAALIDSAFDYPKAEDAPYWRHSLNCYGGAPYEGLSKAAPMLMPIDPHNGQSTLTNLLRHCHDRPMISFLASRVPLDELCTEWEPLHWITVVDQQRMLLRLADTRTLSELPRVLTPQQWSAIAGSVAEWLILDRGGCLTPLVVPKPLNGAPTRINLDQAQLGALLAAAEPDNVMSMISTSMSDILPTGMLNSERYAYIALSCEIARKYEVSNWADVVSFSVAAFLSEGRSIHDEGVARFLKAKAWEDGGLGMALVTEGLI
ncbi:DUF4123 domain-containing protein [Pseudoduganella sp.]|uniref:DUF4123 domain-containing protein n=1 Tax=Pseudoduganella sp. TaxID=1880898 RepID=UPI0035B0A61A